MKRIHFWQVCLLLLLGGWLGGCREKPDPPVAKTYENGVFVLNEGNFQGGNASLDFLHGPGDSISRRIFRAVHDRPLGDVAQSMVVHDGKAWIVVNNSGKVEVLNLPALDQHCIVQGLTSPRYLLFLSSTKVYLSDLYSKSIQILDPQTCSIKGSIATGGWTEEMVLAGGKVFATQTGTDKVLVIDPVSDLLLDSLGVGREPNSLVQDAGGMLWVLCSGGLGETNPQMWTIDPQSNTVSLVLTFSDVNESPERLRIDPAGEWIYWVQSGKVLRLKTSAASPATEVFASGRGGQFYGLDLDPLSGIVYVGDARDYVREGLVYRFNPDGTLLDSFAVGVNPGSFGFE